MYLRRRQTLALPFASLLAATHSPAQAAVDDETWTDPARFRDVPVRIRWPADDLVLPTGGRPVLLFSHGLGGTRAGDDAWGRAWAAAGFVVIHLQHPGSDLEAVKASASRFRDPAFLRRLGDAAQLLSRLQDVGFVLDELARRRSSADGRWASVRPYAVGMSGHSFGAITTFAMAGQRYPDHPGIAESRLAAFVALSPSLPSNDGDASRVFDRITRPMLCLTGTLDFDVAGTGATPERRRAVFAALPAGQKAQLVLQDADHMTFSGQTGRAVEIISREAVTRTLQNQHHEAVAAITSDWWRAHLLGDGEARQRLAKPAGLASGDVWRRG